MKTIQGKFILLHVNNDHVTEFQPDNGEGTIYITIKSLTPEDGGGYRYLINYDGNKCDGYINLKAMKGYINKK